MLKKLIVLAVLFSGQPFLYAQDEEVHEQGIRLVETYLKGDSTEILANWKLKDQENVNVRALLKMQSDLFGEAEYPKKYFAERDPFAPKKTVSVGIVMDSLFSDCPSAKLTCSIFKGKKKKDRFQLTGISIESKEKPNNKFIDSLYTPYLDMLKRGAIDSLIRDAMNYEELTKSMEQLDENKEKAAELISSGLQIMENFLKPELTKIDTSQPISFNSYRIRVNTQKTKLVIELNCSSFDDSISHLLMNFQLIDGRYDLVGLGTGGTSSLH